MKGSDGITEGELLSLIQSARLKRKMGNTAGAINVYNRIIEAKPDCVEAYTELARLYLDSDRFEEARVLSEKALQIDEKDPEANFIVGVLAYIFGNFEKALFHYGIVRERDGLDTSLAVNMGLCYEAKGDLREAAKFFEFAVNAGVGNWRIYEALAQAYESLGERDKALDILERAIKIFKNEGKLYLLAGRAYLEKGQTALAGLRLERAVKLLPDDVEAKRIFGRFLFETSQYERAEEVMKWVIAHEPWLQENWLVYVKAKSALGKYKEALGVLEMAAQFIEKTPELENFIKELKEKSKEESEENGQER
ncbi:MAG: tetratricopeptide repeat protein [Planctomycetota bacterium]|nr:tetratricopeptide repeat protein [Planctomycetota bacterium]